MTVRAGYVFPIRRQDGTEIEVTWQEVMGQIEITAARFMDGSRATLTMEEQFEVEHHALDEQAERALS